LYKDRYTGAQEIIVTVESLLTTAAVTKLRAFADRLGVCLGKLSDDQIWARGHENENAVGNLILHLEGNARQWIVSGLGGQPDIRQRDSEFQATGGMTGAELTEKIRAIIAEATAVIEGLTTEQLTRMYTIQNRSASGVDAVMNVVDHFAQHTGQIIYATKNLTGEDLGLTMPKKKA
jgi:uncharacterized damage-inducible protein DinB